MCCFSFATKGSRYKIFRATWAEQHEKCCTMLRPSHLKLCFISSLLTRRDSSANFIQDTTWSFQLSYSTDRADQEPKPSKEAREFKTYRNHHCSIGEYTCLPLVCCSASSGALDGLDDVFGRKAAKSFEICDGRPLFTSSRHPILSAEQFRVSP